MTTKSLGGSPRGGEGESASASSSRGAWDVQGSPRPGSPYRTAAEWGRRPPISRRRNAIFNALFIILFGITLYVVGTTGAELLAGWR